MKIHIAGFPVRVGTRIRQICAWCGHVFTDEDLQNIFVAPGPDGKLKLIDETWYWPIGVLVEVDGGVSRLVRHEDGDPIPPLACASPGLELVP